MFETTTQKRMFFFLTPKKSTPQFHSHILPAHLGCGNHWCIEKLARRHLENESSWIHGEIFYPPSKTKIGLRKMEGFLKIFCPFFWRVMSQVPAVNIWGALHLPVEPILKGPWHGIQLVSRKHHGSQQLPVEWKNGDSRDNSAYKGKYSTTRFNQYII